MVDAQRTTKLPSKLFLRVVKTRRDPMIVSRRTKVATEGSRCARKTRNVQQNRRTGYRRSTRRFRHPEGLEDPEGHPEGMQTVRTLPSDAFVAYIASTTLK